MNKCYICNKSTDKLICPCPNCPLTYYVHEECLIIKKVIDNSSSCLYCKAHLQHKKKNIDQSRLLIRLLLLILMDISFLYLLLYIFSDNYNLTISLFLISCYYLLATIYNLNLEKIEIESIASIISDGIPQLINYLIDTDLMVAKFMREKKIKGKERKFLNILMKFFFRYTIFIHVEILREKRYRDYNWVGYLYPLPVIEGEEEGRNIEEEIEEENNEEIDEIEIFENDLRIDNEWNNRKKIEEKSILEVPILE